MFVIISGYDQISDFSDNKASVVVNQDACDKYTVCGGFDCYPASGFAMYDEKMI